MPKLWNDSIATHRQAVREAILDATAALVAERGLTGITMAEVAHRAGVGRATLYKYFADVDSALTAWHQRQVAGHLQQLSEIWERTHRIDDVLEAYAFICHEHPPAEAASSLHRSEHVGHAREHLVEFIAERLGAVRDDVPPKELATYCVHALQAAGAVPSKAAVRRLVQVTLDGLRSQPGG
ncbi:TetR/AcrR family transcriptional regulator [Kribbella sp. VKM Ac-2566]|uniref:TetR/AcrR family transcriptional regulator n=1 Tax=Kribbella sp. VKM Ac-2566 TaxID=2512218 RepID=UPI001062CB70|nr:TetR/AcrR family transcriptional regulator [Kribbella sp. VKM Ac-2566]TDW91778.1 TetR family transcriptional regulator [Kribbella sp. VKM Ac-2566]